MEKAKKGRPGVILPKPCGFRVNVGESFWYMIYQDDKLVPKEGTETEDTLYITNKNGKTINQSSIPASLAENGNYYRTEQDCVNRINYLNNK